MAQQKTTKRASEPTYTKHSLVNSSMYTPAEKSILKLELADGAEYTLKDVNKIIVDFKKGI